MFRGGFCLGFGVGLSKRHIAHRLWVVSLRKVHFGHGQFAFFLSLADVWRLAGSSSFSSFVSFSCVGGFGRRFFEGFSRMSSGESVCFRLTDSWGTLFAIVEGQTATLKT